eukprot:11253556-Karenia_brevis.AAC.1
MALKGTLEITRAHPENLVHAHIHHTCPPHSGNRQFIRMRFKATARMCTYYLTNASLVLQGFFQLLSCFRISSSGDTSGITWIEIFCLSIACSPNPLALYEHRSAQTQKTIVNHLREFVTSAL